MSDNSENNRSNNTGCIIGVIIFIIVNLVSFFEKNDADSIAESGGAVLAIAGLVIAYFVCKALFGKDSNKTGNSKVSFHNATESSEKEKPTDKTPWGGILIGVACIIVTVAIIGVMTSSFSINYAVGVIVVIVLASGIGYFIFNSSKD